MYSRCLDRDHGTERLSTTKRNNNNTIVYLESWKFNLQNIKSVAFGLQALSIYTELAFIALEKKLALFCISYMWILIYKLSVALSTRGARPRNCKCATIMA